MRGRQKLYALGAALFFGLSTLMLTRYPVISPIRAIGWPQRFLYALLLPGLLVGFMFGRNNAAQTWIAVFANFVLYFGLAFLVGMVWKKRKARRQRD